MQGRRRRRSWGSQMQSGTGQRFEACQWELVCQLDQMLNRRVVNAFLCDVQSCQIRDFELQHTITKVNTHPDAIIKKRSRAEGSGLLKRMEVCRRVADIGTRNGD
eukprot:scaffold94622_cov15-Tisochrysis_lutea.AAC.1